jgi:hypothetical protein
MWAGMNVVILVSFAAAYWLSTRHQMDATLDVMQDFWNTSFPPLATPWKLPPWLLLVHTSELMAHPIGGETGRSAATALLVAIGLGLLWRRKQWSTLWLLLPAFGLTLVAAAMRLYPYGGAIRLNLYLAPAICTLAALGLAELIRRLPAGPHRLRVTSGVLAALAVLGIGCGARDVVSPYKSSRDQRAREFAQWIWDEAAQQGEVACVVTDLKQKLSPAPAEYLCHQRIYSARHARGEQVRWDRISQDHPLSCVVYYSPDVGIDATARDRWLESMQSRYRLVGTETMSLVRSQRSPQPFACIEIYRFAPASEDRGPVARDPDASIR